MASRQTERRWELQLVAVRVADPGKLAEVWVQLDAIRVPHRELLLRVAAIRPARGRIPGPDPERVEQVQPVLEPTARQIGQVADEVAVDVVRVRLVLDERAVDEDVRDPHLPELTDEDREMVDEPFPPASIPGRDPIRRTGHEHRQTKLAERQGIVRRRQTTRAGEGRQHLASPQLASQQRLGLRGTGHVVWGGKGAACMTTWFCLTYMSSMACAYSNQDGGPARPLSACLAPARPGAPVRVLMPLHRRERRPVAGLEWSGEGASRTCATELAPRSASPSLVHPSFVVLTAESWHIRHEPRV